MRQESYVDRNFRWYGEAFFGKMAMDRITSEQVEEARDYWASKNKMILKEMTK